MDFTQNQISSFFFTKETEYKFLVIFLYIFPIFLLVFNINILITYKFRHIKVRNQVKISRWSNVINHIHTREWLGKRGGRPRIAEAWKWEKERGTIHLKRNSADLARKKTNESGNAPSPQPWTGRQWRMLIDLIKPSGRGDRWTVVIWDWMRFPSPSRNSQRKRGPMQFWSTCIQGLREK